MQRAYLDFTHLTAGDKEKKAQKRWVVLNSEGEGGGVCLDQYDSEYFETTGTVRSSIPLKNCRNLEVSKSSPHSFEFTCNAGSFRFGCSSKEEADRWLEKIRRATSHERMKFSDSVVPNTSVHIHADEVSGSPSTSSGTFSVTLKQNQVAKRLKFTGRYNLRITLRKISLHEEESDARVATWTYDQFRTFTSYKNRIEIDAGRRSETGPGLYIFLTPRAEEICQLMTTNIKTLEEKIERMNAAKEREKPDPFENPNYNDSLFPLTNLEEKDKVKVPHVFHTPAEKDKVKVPHDPYGNPGYEDNAHLMDSPTSHQRLDLNGIDTSRGRSDRHDYEDLEFLQNPAPKKVPAEQHYAEPYAITTTTKGVQEAVGYITMQEAHLNALSLVQPTGGNDAANAAPKLPGEHIYSKVNKPSKPLTTDKNGGQSPNVAARPEKGAASVAQPINSLIHWEDFESDPEYVPMKPNPSYAVPNYTVKSSSTFVPAEQPPASLLLAMDDQSVSRTDDSMAAAMTTAEPIQHAGNFEEIDRMWNETWNT